MCSNLTTDGKLAILNLTSLRPGCDLSCQISAGEPPFVVHDTVVAYSQYAMMPREAFEFLVAHRWYDPWPDVSSDLLRRIQNGALDSRYLSGIAKAAIRAAMA